MANHEELLDTIGNMTVLELSEFVDAFKDKFNVTALAAPVAMPAVMHAASAWSTYSCGVGPWPWPRVG